MAEKIKCDCGITFRPEEGQTHCNYCGKKFTNINKKKISSKKEIKKPIETMGNEIPNKFLAILLALIILFASYFYVRAENNEKNLRNKEFTSNLEPTPTILQPTPTPTTTPIRIQPTVDPDPIIDCKFTYLGTIRLRRSVCSKSTDCQIGGKWVYYDSVEKCKADQKASNNSTGSVSNTFQPVNYYKCTLCYHNYQSSDNCVTYDSLVKTKAECDAEQAKLDSYGKSYVIPTATPTINQSAIDEYNQLVKDHQTACDAAAADWIRIREQFEATQFNNYSSSAEAVMALQQRMAQYQQELYGAGCSNKISL